MSWPPDVGSLAGDKRHSEARFLSPCSDLLIITEELITKQCQDNGVGASEVRKRGVKPYDRHYFQLTETD